MDSALLYEQHRALIDGAITRLCRRQRLSGADADDFAGAARLHLIDDGCAVLRRFEGRSSMETFLSVVVANLFHDWRNARWGKWRASAAATRLGPLAVRLERLIVRDRHSLDEAHEILRTNERRPETRRALEEIASRLPLRTGRQTVNEDALADQPSSDLTADATLLRQEAAAAARHAGHLLSVALSRLSDQDRIILRMRFEEDFKIVDIATCLSLEPKLLYRRVAGLLATLRRTLEGLGLDQQRATHLMELGGFEYEIRDSRESPATVRLSGSGQKPSAFDEGMH